VKTGLRTPCRPGHLISVAWLMLAYAPSFRDLKLGHNWDVRLLEYVASSLAASVINFLSKYLFIEIRGAPKLKCHCSHEVDLSGWALQVEILSTLSVDSLSVPVEIRQGSCGHRSNEHRSVTPPKIRSLESTSNINGRICAGTQSSRYSIESWREESRDVPQGESSITQEVESSA
jgi:hypothetical protein